VQVRFGPFLLDSESRELLRDRSRVPLSPKAFDLLCILIADRPKAISKRELQERLWPATFVVEKNLANLERVHGSRSVSDGDVITVSSVKLTVRALQAPTSTESEPAARRFTD